MGTIHKDMQNIISKLYKPFTEEIIQKVMDEIQEQDKKDLEEETVYYYFNGWQKCSGKTYKQIFKCKQNN